MCIISFGEEKNMLPFPFKTYETPSSLVVKTPTSITWQNQQQLIDIPSIDNFYPPQGPTEETAVTQNNPGYHPRSERLSVPPNRLGN